MCVHATCTCICKTCFLPGSGGLNLHVVAMALSGYYDNKNTLWQEMCQSLYSRLDDAYLRAMFAFLTCEDDKYDSVLVRTPALRPPPNSFTSFSSPMPLPQGLARIQLLIIMVVVCLEKIYFK